MGCIPTGSSVYGISHPRILEWVAISSSRNVLNITKQLTSSLRWMSAWGLLILGKVNQTFQKLYSLLTGVPRDFQGRHTASYTRDTTQLSQLAPPTLLALLPVVHPRTSPLGNLLPTSLYHTTQSPPLSSQLLGRHQQCPSLGITTISDGEKITLKLRWVNGRVGTKERVLKYNL